MFRHPYVSGQRLRCLFALKSSNQRQRTNSIPAVARVWLVAAVTYLLLAVFFVTGTANLLAQEAEQLPSLINPPTIIQPEKVPSVIEAEPIRPMIDAGGLPSAIDGTNLSADPSHVICDGCGQCGDACGCHGCSPYVVTARTGLDSFSVMGDARLGALYGADLAYHLAGEWGFWGAANVSHFSAGSQLLGSVGAVKIPNLCGCRATSPFMFAVLFDQFKDSRVNNLYLSRMRIQMGYTFCSGLEVGTVYTESLSDDDDINFIILDLGSNTRGTVRHSQHLSFYAGKKLGLLNWTGMLGYSDETDEYSLGTIMRLPVSCNVGSVAGAHYGTDRGSWVVTAGFEMQFGRTRDCAPSGCDDCIAADIVDDVIVRGQDSSTRSYFTPGGGGPNNALWGDYFYVDGTNAFSQSFGSTHLDILNMYSAPSSFWGEVYVASLRDPLAFGFDTVIEGTRRRAAW